MSTTNEIDEIAEFTDEDGLTSRTDSRLSVEEMLIYAKPFAHSASCPNCSTRPENVPALQLNLKPQTQNKASGSVDILSNLQDDLSHYGNILKGSTDQMCETFSQMFLRPSRPATTPEQNEECKAKETISLVNAFGRKLLPVFGIFYDNGDMFTININE